jgi:hypothetical protein
MRPTKPELLLLFYLVLPINQGPLVAQVLLSQIRAIYAARQAEKNLVPEIGNSDEPDLEDLALEEANAQAANAQALKVQKSELQDLDDRNSDHSSPNDYILNHYRTVREFLSALWLDPSNTSAYAYSGLLFPLIADCRLQTPTEGFDRL